MALAANRKANGLPSTSSRPISVAWARSRSSISATRSQTPSSRATTVASKLSRNERLSKLAVPTAAKSRSTRATFWCMNPSSYKNTRTPTRATSGKNA